MDRRGFLVTAAALAAAETGGRWVSRLPPSPGTRLILLGTAGGPRPHTARAAPAQVIVVNGASYVVDCGNGVARQYAAAGLSLHTLRHVFVTHHHSDHNADYGNLLLIAWESGLQTLVDTWGPPPLSRMTDLFFEMNALDIEARVIDEGRPPLRPLVRVHEFRGAGTVFQDANVKVSATVVHHPPIAPAFAYRFDAADRSIVISGDTSYSEPLIRLAQGADILVHEAMFPSAIDRLVAKVPNATDLKRSILSHHTTAEDAGRVAQSAEVKLLILSHLVPADDPMVSEADWIDAARRRYRGEVILGRDLLVV